MQFFVETAVIINLQFKQFVNKHYSKICEKFKVDEQVLKTAISEIEKLNPKPASSSSHTKYTQQITPDFTRENKFLETQK